MKTTNVSILRQFQTVLNRKHLTEEILSTLLKRWDLYDVDLDQAMIDINLKKSKLSKSRREAVPEFLKLRELLKEAKNNEINDVSFEQSTKNLAEDTLVVN